MTSQMTSAPLFALLIVSGFFGGNLVEADPSECPVSNEGATMVVTAQTDCIGEENIAKMEVDSEGNMAVSSLEQLCCIPYAYTGCSDLCEPASEGEIAKYMAEYEEWKNGQKEQGRAGVVEGRTLPFLRRFKPSDLRERIRRQVIEGCCEIGVGMYKAMYDHNSGICQTPKNTAWDEETGIKADVCEKHGVDITGKSRKKKAKNLEDGSNSVRLLRSLIGGISLICLLSAIAGFLVYTKSKKAPVSKRVRVAVQSSRVSPRSRSSRIGTSKTGVSSKVSRASRIGSLSVKSAKSASPRSSKTSPSKVSRSASQASPRSSKASPLKTSQAPSSPSRGAYRASSSKVVSGSSRTSKTSPTEVSSRASLSKAFHSRAFPSPSSVSRSRK